MDAADAAEYVQELAGEEANIIFGAMYDDSRAVSYTHLNRWKENFQDGTDPSSL